MELGGPDQTQARKLASLVRALHQTGHNPATSGNYSLRPRSQMALCFISESGIDKSQFEETNLLPVLLENAQLLDGYSHRKSSAESALHLTLYQNTSAGCVLHSHLLEAILFADLFPGQASIEVGGLELLKGLSGVKTHETTVAIPCFENTQDMDDLALRLKSVLNEQPMIKGFLVRKHGLYVWGNDVDEAKRHLEVFEYLFRYYLRS